jgi:hypothetical protein
MKTLSCKFFTLFIVLFGMMDVYAGKGAGPPAPTAKGVSLAAGPPPPPGTPIDENIFILFSAAVLLGIYIIYRNNLKKKPI